MLQSTIIFYNLIHKLITSFCCNLRDLVLKVMHEKAMDEIDVTRNTISDGFISFQVDHKAIDNK